MLFFVVLVVLSFRQSSSYCKDATRFSRKTGKHIFWKRCNKRFEQRCNKIFQQIFLEKFEFQNARSHSYPSKRLLPESPFHKIPFSKIPFLKMPSQNYTSIPSKNKLRFINATIATILKLVQAVWCRTTENTDNSDETLVLTILAITVLTHCIEAPLDFGSKEKILVWTMYVLGWWAIDPDHIMPAMFFPCLTRVLSSILLLLVQCSPVKVCLRAKEGQALLGTNKIINKLGRPLERERKHRRSYWCHFGKLVTSKT